MSAHNFEPSIVAAATMWWQSRRHSGDSQSEQIEKDTSFHGVERDPERLLARNVALAILARSEDTRR